MSLRAITGWLAILALLLPLSAQAEDADIWHMEIDGAIGPATADHLIRGIDRAQQADASLVLVRIDTPGGLDQAMREMIKAILDSDIPIACHVSPRGARATSAGTYIMYACHANAMAPGTTIGAATPVQMGGGGGMPSPNGDEENEAQQPGGSAMERKVINDAVAYIQSLAELRDRNAEWAEAAVRDGVSLSADKAHEAGVVDFLAGDLEELLARLDGLEIAMNGETLTLATTDRDVHFHETDWRTEFLSVITNPNIAYILLLVGIYGLIFEFSNPGMGVPGIAGVICLLLAMYALQLLPINYAGLALIIVGLGLMVAEVFMPSFGVLGVGGVVAFAVGSIILMDTELPGFQIAAPVIAAVTVSSAVMLIIVLGMVMRSVRHKVVTGLPHLIGETARVERVDKDSVFVRLEGELWQVQCDEPLSVDDTVEVINAEGLVLKVSKLPGESS